MQLLSTCHHGKRMNDGWLLYLSLYRRTYGTHHVLLLVRMHVHVHARIHVELYMYTYVHVYGTYYEVLHVVRVLPNHSFILPYPMHV